MLVSVWTITEKHRDKVTSFEQLHQPLFTDSIEEFDEQATQDLKTARENTIARSCGCHQNEIRKANSQMGNQMNSIKSSQNGKYDIIIVPMRSLKRNGKTET